MLPVRQGNQSTALGSDPAAGILRKERQHRRGISQLFLVIIPKGIEPFAPTMESGYDYLSRNRRHIIAEQIKFAPMFEKYYGYSRR